MQMSEETFWTKEINQQQLLHGQKIQNNIFLNAVKNKWDCIRLPKNGDNIAQRGGKQPILFIRRCHLSGWYNPTLLPNRALLCASGDKNIESPHAHAVHWVRDC